MRLDKYLAQSGERTRREAGKALRAGKASVNGQTVKDGAYQLKPGDEVRLDGVPVADNPYFYVMLHKPAGLLTAARDSRAATVMTLLPENLIRRKVLPVGRLDKDTTGLLLLTNDGELAHRLLSPKRHVWKQYRATVAGALTAEDQAAFEAGVPLKDFTALPAKLTILAAGEAESTALVTVREGKYHQVKRMLGARGHEVLALCRLSFGSLLLPSDLPLGAYRMLSDKELEALQKCAENGAESGIESFNG